MGVYSSFLVRAYFTKINVSNLLLPMITVFAVVVKTIRINVINLFWRSTQCG